MVTTAKLISSDPTISVPDEVHVLDDGRAIACHADSGVVHVRTVEQAYAILREEGAISWIGLTDEQALGCTVARHHVYLTTEPESEIRAWAKSVAGDE